MSSTQPLDRGGFRGFRRKEANSQHKLADSFVDCCFLQEFSKPLADVMLASLSSHRKPTGFVWGQRSAPPVAEEQEVTPIPETGFRNASLTHAAPCGNSRLQGEQGPISGATLPAFEGEDVAGLNASRRCGLQYPTPSLPPSPLPSACWASAKLHPCCLPCMAGQAYHPFPRYGDGCAPPFEGETGACRREYRHYGPYWQQVLQGGGGVEGPSC